MKHKQLPVVLISLLLLLEVVPLQFGSVAQTSNSPDLLFGVDMGYGTDVAGAKSLIDEVSSFTNFFMLGSSALSYNNTLLNETLQYAYDRGMYFMSFAPRLNNYNNTVPEKTQELLEYAREQWNGHLLGFLYPWEDEPGGHQLDRISDYLVVPDMEKTNYTDAARQFNDSMWFWFLNQTRDLTNYPMFTSDYALYYFDYKAGYDGVFAEFGWNYSRQLNVAMCRGAATVLNKEWGIIITYEYTDPPYIESGDELYQDLIYAYDSGAKYIIIFNSNPDWTEGILTEEHYEAMRRFWTYTQEHPRVKYPVRERIAYALPEAYAYGFRGPLDKIWGLWEADMTSFMLSISVGIMLEKYGSRLDIIYEDTLSSADAFGYKDIIYWNDPDAVRDRWPPGYLPIPDPKQNSTKTSSPKDTPIEQPNLDADNFFGFPQNLFFWTILTAAVGVVVAAILMFRKRTKTRRREALVHETEIRSLP